MKKAFNLFILSILFTASSFAQDTPTTWKSYSTEAYEVKYPSTWEFNNTTSSTMDFLALCPLESDDDKMRESLNLVKENAQNLSLDAYFESSKKMLEKTFPMLEIISTEDFENNGVAMKRLTYNATFGADVLYFSQAYTVYNNIAYVLTFNSEGEKYKSFQNIEDAIFKSFKILK